MSADDTIYCDSKEEAEKEAKRINAEGGGYRGGVFASVIHINGDWCVEIYYEK